MKTWEVKFTTDTRSITTLIHANDKASANVIYDMLYRDKASQLIYLKEQTETNE